MIQGVKAEKYTGEEFITIFSEHFKLPLVVPSDHVNYTHVVEALEGADKLVGDEEKKRAERIEGLINLSIKVAKEFKKITERISVAGGYVYFDGDLVDNSITAQIVRYFEEGNNDLTSLVLFMEKLYQNPNEHSRTQLYDWLNVANFSITNEGDIVAYKGVSGEWQSTNKGHAIADGKEYFDSYIPNLPGTVVEMPRSEVAHDPGAACSVGLHAARYDYATSFGGSNKKVVEIRVNPRDVVSVPKHDRSKFRTCRYTVVGEAKNPHAKALVTDPKPALTDKAKDAKVADKPVVKAEWYDNPREGMVISEKGKADRPNRVITDTSHHEYVKTSKEGGALGIQTKTKRKNLKRYNLVKG